MTVAILFLTAHGALAAEPYGPTEEETRFLPAYCGGPGGGDWKAILGPEAIFNNHTCYGINRINRHYRSKQTWEKRQHLDIALMDFNYSVGHLSPGFKLMPEIYYYRGVTYRLMGREAEAMADFLRSINMDPKYAKSVAELSDLYDRKLSDRKKALALVTEGLRHSPASRELQRRYQQYGGALPYPEPYAKPEPQERLAVQPDSPKQVEPAVSAKPSEAPVAATPSKPAAAGLTTGAIPEQPVATGTPSNPWCRFCPDAERTRDPGGSKPPAEPTGGR